MAPAPLGPGQADGPAVVHDEQEQVLVVHAGQPVLQQGPELLPARRGRLEMLPQVVELEGPQEVPLSAPLRRTRRKVNSTRPSGRAAASSEFWITSRTRTSGPGLNDQTLALPKSRPPSRGTGRKYRMGRAACRGVSVGGAAAHVAPSPVREPVGRDAEGDGHGVELAFRRRPGASSQWLTSAGTAPTLRRLRAVQPGGKDRPRQPGGRGILDDGHLLSLRR